jgi:hypothetical protein
MTVTTTRKGKKVAYATRVGGDLYNVTYGDGIGCDREVPWAYLRGLLRKGYTVELDQGGHRGEGEPAHETYTPDMA